MPAATKRVRPDRRHGGLRGLRHPPRLRDQCWRSSCPCTSSPWGSRWRARVRWTDSSRSRSCRWSRRRSGRWCSLLTIHLVFGLRVLALEFLPWRGARKHWIGWGAGLAVAAGAVFLVRRRMRCLIHRQRTDILILGSGGAGLLAALHAKQAAPDLDVTVAVKGLMGKCGCTRMVQGGYNVALAPGDSLERHFMDTIVGGKWLPRQDLAWKPVRGRGRAHPRARERDRLLLRPQPDGTLHQKAFAGQSFDRTVHKGDLTGIEIINRLMEQVRALDVHRAGRASRHRAGPGAGRIRARRRAAHRHAKRRLSARAGQGRAAGHRRRAHHVSLPHAVGRQDLRRVWPWRCARAESSRHGDGAVPSDRAAGRSRHADDRHGAGGGPARGRGLPAERRRRAVHGQAYDPGGRARHPRYRQPRHLCRDARRAHTPMGGVYLQMGHLGPEKVAARNSPAWSSAARTAASISPADASRSYPRPTT